MVRGDCGIVIPVERNGDASSGRLSFSSSGTGGANHLSGELFKQMAAVDIVNFRV
jgi:hypothetical protein